MQIDENVWNVVRNVAGSRNGGDIDAIENPIRIFAENRLAHDSVLPGDEISLLVQCCIELVQIHGPVLTAPHFILACPEQFHWKSAIDRFGDLNGLQRTVSPPAETPPSVECMNVDLLRAQPGDPGRVILHARNVPIPGPDVALIW